MADHAHSLESSEQQCASNDTLTGEQLCELSNATGASETDADRADLRTVQELRAALEA